MVLLREYFKLNNNISEAFPFENWGYHSGVDEDFPLPEYDPVQIAMQVQTFQEAHKTPLQMDTALSSESVETIYQSTWRRILFHNDPFSLHLYC
jgi:hypothetical protein